MEKFLETYNLPKLNHKELENMNGPVTSKKLNQQTQSKRIIHYDEVRFIPEIQDWLNL